MRSVCAAIVLLLVSTVSIHASTPDKWAIDVQFPAEPKRVEREQPTPAGNIREEHIYTEDGNRVFAVVKTTFPVPVPEERAEQLYANGRDMMVRLGGGTLKSDETFDVAGGKGRRYVVIFETTKRMSEYRVILINQALYMAAFDAPATDFDETAARSFLGSLKRKPAK